MCRLNRLFMRADHYDNPGGAVAARNTRTEQKNIKILRRKWGSWIANGRNKDEIKLNFRYDWNKHPGYSIAPASAF